MRTFQLVVVLVLSYSSLAWADVGPRPPPCSAPTDCTVCQKAAGDALTD